MLFLFTINLISIQQSDQLLNNGVNTKQTLHKQDHIINDNFTSVNCCLPVSESLKEGSLELGSHSLGTVTVFLLDCLQGKEDLHLQLLRELVIDDSDKSTANLDDFLLDGSRLTELKHILNSEGSVNSDTNVTMHNCSLNVVNNRLDAGGNLED